MRLAVVALMPGVDAPFKGCQFPEPLVTAASQGTHCLQGGSPTMAEHASRQKGCFPCFPAPSTGIAA